MKFFFHSFSYQKKFTGLLTANNLSCRQTIGRCTYANNQDRITVFNDPAAIIDITLIITHGDLKDITYICWIKLQRTYNAIPLKFFFSIELKLFCALSDLWDEKSARFLYFLRTYILLQSRKFFFF